MDAYGHGEAMELNEDDVIVVAAASLLLGYAYDELQGKKRKKRKYWVKPWIASREAKGAYNILVTELSLTECGTFSYSGEGAGGESGRWGM